MEKKEFLGNIDIKSLITLVALILWIANTIWGMLNGEFATVFDYFKEVFMMVISFYLGTKSAKLNGDTSAEVPDGEPKGDFE